MRFLFTQVRTTEDAQFSVMQLAMDWFYSPIRAHRALVDGYRKLYYTRGPGVREDVPSVEAILQAGCPLAVFL